MLNLVLAAALQDIAKAQQVGVGVIVRLVNGIAHTGLGGQMQHLSWSNFCKQTGHAIAIGYIQLYKAKIGKGAQLIEPRLLECHVVVVVEVVDANHGHALREQSLGAVHADKAGSAGDQNGIHGVIQRYWYCAGVALAGIFSKGMLSDCVEACGRTVKISSHQCGAGLSARVISSSGPCACKLA